MVTISAFTGRPHSSQSPSTSHILQVISDQLSALRLFCNIIRQVLPQTLASASAAAEMTKRKAQQDHSGQTDGKSGPPAAKKQALSKPGQPRPMQNPPGGSGKGTHKKPNANPKQPKKAHKKAKQQAKGQAEQNAKSQSKAATVSKPDAKSNISSTTQPSKAAPMSKPDAKFNISSTTQPTYEPGSSELGPQSEVVPILKRILSVVEDIRDILAAEAQAWD